MSSPVNSQPIRRLPGGLPLLLALTLLLGTFGPASAAPGESMRVWRAQVRFVTSSNSDAGTDDDVQVSLNDSNRTWLDYGRDDFETGDTFTYDLLLTNLHTLTDIKRQLKESGTTMFAIGLGTKVDTAPLNELADLSGGRALLPQDVSELGTEFQRVVEDLRRRYIVGYTSTNGERNGQWRNVNITLKSAPEVTVRSAGGYSAPER